MAGKEIIYLKEIAQEAIIPETFFKIFPEKISVLKEILAKGFGTKN